MANNNYRVVEEPRISANELARFIVATPVSQEGIIRNAHWQPKIMTFRYREARRSISKYLADPFSKYLADPLRKAAHFDQAIRALNEKTRNSDKPRVVLDAEASIEVIDSFQQGYNVYGFGSYKFVRPPSRIPHLLIDGVDVSVNLDLLVTGRDDNHQPLVGGLIMRFSKSDDSQTEAAKSRRADIARYASVLVYMQLHEHFHTRGIPETSLCFSLHVHRKELFHAPRDHLNRTNNIHAACRRISEMWDRVPPPAGLGS